MAEKLATYCRKENEKMKKTVIYEADDGFVEFENPSTLHWYWDNGDGNTGDEYVPFEDAADYFEGSGREDIAKLIRNRETYHYGHYGQF